jgi:uncharacterized protein
VLPHLLAVARHFPALRLRLTKVFLAWVDSSRPPVEDALAAATALGLDIESTNPAAAASIEELRRYHDERATRRESRRRLAWQVIRYGVPSAAIVAVVCSVAVSIKERRERAEQLRIWNARVDAVHGNAVVRARAYRAAELASWETMPLERFPYKVEWDACSRYIEKTEAHTLTHPLRSRVEKFTVSDCKATVVVSQYGGPTSRIDGAANRPFLDRRITYQFDLRDLKADSAGSRPWADVKAVCHDTSHDESRREFGVRARPGAVLIRFTDKIQQTVTNASVSDVWLPFHTNHDRAFHEAVVRSWRNGIARCAASETIVSDNTPGAPDTPGDVEAASDHTTGSPPAAPAAPGASAARPSFDCTHVTTNVERAICGNARLAELDEQMTRAFRAVLDPASRTEHDAVLLAQRTWLSDRDRCNDSPDDGTAQCLLASYETRVRELRQVAAGAAGAPRIVTAPRNYYAAFNGSVTFEVVATGTQPLRYQWYNNDRPLANGTNVTGVTTPRLTMRSLQPFNAGTVRVDVANAFGSSSATATLGVSR